MNEEKNQSFLLLYWIYIASENLEHPHKNVQKCYVTAENSLRNCLAKFSRGFADSEPELTAPSISNFFSFLEVQ